MNMRSLIVIAALLCLGTSAAGQRADDAAKPAADAAQPPAEGETPVVAPYSRETLQRVFSADADLPPPPQPGVHYGVGYVEFRALGLDWRFTYLPIMMPLSGTRMTTSQEMVDPFVLTGAPIATTSRTFVTRREVNRERKRIAKTEKARLKAQNQ